MPSKLFTTSAEYAGRSGAARARSVGAAEQRSRGRQTVEFRGPFLGLQPDVDPNLTDGTAFNELENVLARAHGEEHGEVLGLPDGFRQLDSARLALGDRATLPAAAGNADPVVRIDQISRFAPTGHASPGEYTGEFTLTPLAVTAGDGTTNLSGNMYRIAASGQWTHIEESAATSDARALKAGRDGRTSSPSMPDSCIAPFGAVARVANTGAPGDDGQTGPILEPCWIFTNDVDEVMVFPSATSETIVGTHRYEPLTNLAPFDGGAGAGFKAKSCETWNGRVYFLNVSMGGTRFNQRLVRTPKFTADPSTALVGGGNYDFREFQGEGQRAETLGDVLGVYFSDGVAFMRPTGVPTSPDEPQVISTERGLLATHALTSIGRNVHFGIFTDGWWLLDQSGRWQELGVVNLDGKVVPKWRQTFYESIPPNMRHRLYCYYDQPNNLIYIAKPTTEAPDPQEVWIYDPTSDRVFIENYPVTCFGTYTPATAAGVTIDALPGAIDDLVGTIDSFAPVVGFPKVRVHGDLTGYVYQHRRDISGFDSATSPPVVQDPAWLWSLGLRSPGGFRNLTTVDRVSLEYFNHDNLSNVSVEVRGPRGSQTRSVVFATAATEELRYRDAWFRFTDHAIGVAVSGTGEFHIRGAAVDIISDPIEPRGL